MASKRAASNGASVLSMLSSPSGKGQGARTSPTSPEQTTPAKTPNDQAKKPRVQAKTEVMKGGVLSFFKAAPQPPAEQPPQQAAAEAKTEAVKGGVLSFLKATPKVVAEQQQQQQSSAEQSQHPAPSGAEGAAKRTAEVPLEKAAQAAGAQPGKKQQRRVNEKKTKEEERKKAAELLQANAGKFAATLEDNEEPGDEAEDVEDETWDVDRRLQVAETAWASSAANATAAAAPDVSAAAVPTAGSGSSGSAALSFHKLASFLEAAAAGEAPTLCAVANAVRTVLRESEDKEADLNAILTVLLASKQPVSHRHLSDAVSVSFALKSHLWREASQDVLADLALASRQKQRMLFQGRGKRLSVVEVAGVLEEYGTLAAEARKTMYNSPESMNVRTCLTKILGASVAEGRETWHLVRVLQGRLGFAWDAVLRGLAHAFTLAPPGAASAPAWASGRARAEAMVAMEDAILRAYSQDGGRVGRLVKALLAGSTGEALVDACAPTAGVPVAPMQAEAAKEIAGSLEKLGEGAVLAEWLLCGERAQVHVQEGGKVIQVFSTRLAPRPDRIEDAKAVLTGHMKGVESCILDVIFPRPVKKTTEQAKEQEQVPGQEKAQEQDKDQQQETKDDDKEKEQEKGSKSQAMALFDILALNGAPLSQRPLRERRAALEGAFEQHALMRFVKGSEIPAGELSAQAVRAKLDEALGAGFLTSGEEKIYSRAMGVVFKKLDGPGASYFAGRRFQSWQALERPPVTGAEAERLLFEALSEEERKFIPAADEFHFTVISGFRTRSVEGITDILRIQKLYNDAGVVPTWYVDNECPDEYRKLGLKVVKAGKLIPARNHALRDAVEVGKMCVQTSDDIGSWMFFNDATKYSTDEEANAAWKRCEKLNISPVAAARYLAAKARARGKEKCMLSGVYPLSNGGRAMRAYPFSTFNFILGDFFVAEPASPCRFDTTMTLKEDYDYTCQHLSVHGSVLRFNRMVITVKHATNVGGAVAVRDQAGSKERQNIEILQRKWPGVFHMNGRRKDANSEVVMSWKRYKGNSADDENEEEPASRPKSGAARGAGKKLTLAAAAKLKKKRQAPAGLSSEGLVRRTAKRSKAEYINARCRLCDRKTVGKCVGMTYKDSKGNDATYRYTDLKYDMAGGFLEVEGPHRRQG
mmetsp:Transcript_145359/g.362524  ORF Transcript_145359/g.362524 Transcript_145359/m.362524 type:complete len:1154 (+) Transcript_145359:72-3533(+)